MPDSDPHSQIVCEATKALQLAFHECVHAIKQIPKIENNPNRLAAYKMMATAMVGPLCVLLPNMSEDELISFMTVYHEALFRHPLAFGVVQKYHDAFRTAGVEEYKGEREVKARYAERDAEIVRLRDVEKLPWKEVLKRIRSNADWAEGPNGTSLSLEAIKKAHQRATHIEHD